MKHKILSKNQIDELLDKSKPNKKHNLIIKFFLDTGVHVSELISLKCAQIKWGKVVLQNRSVPISNELYKEIHSIISNKSSTDLVFESHKKSKKYQVSTIVHMINQYSVQCKSIGCKIGTNSLRRTFIHNLSKKIRDTNQIAYLLGILPKSFEKIYIKC